MKAALNQKASSEFNIAKFKLMCSGIPFAVKKTEDGMQFIVSGFEGKFDSKIESIIRKYLA